MAHLLPEPPDSRSPRRRFAFRELLGSRRFWARVTCLSLLLASLWPLNFSRTSNPLEDIRVRIFVDTSASMAVKEDSGTRLDEARSIASTILGTFGNTKSDGCADLALVSDLVQIIPVERIPLTLTEISATDRGASPKALVSALRLNRDEGCGGVPSHAVVISDLASPVVTDDIYAGHLIWYQVGGPADNVAIQDVQVQTGGLRGREPHLQIEVNHFGTAPNDLRIDVEHPLGRSEVSLSRDAERSSRWSAAFPIGQVGTFTLTLTDGGAFAGDDRVTVHVGPIVTAPVDWQLTEVPRPSGFSLPGRSGATILVASYPGRNEALPSNNFVLTYDGWPSPSDSVRIGPFMHNHPILDSVNFDALEQTPPRGVVVSEYQQLHNVVQADEVNRLRTWVAVRDSPRGAIVPKPEFGGGQNREALSLLLFFNALKWVADSFELPPPKLQWQDSNGHTFHRALAESDTARPLAESPSLALLREPPRSGLHNASEDQQSGSWAAWLILLALAIMVVERVIGPVWASERTA